MRFYFSSIPWIDRLMIVAAMTITVGIFVDGWAHNNLVIVDGFLSPWHLIFYTGLLTAVLILTGAILSKKNWGKSLVKRIPFGYTHSLIGCVLFGVGAVIDLGWHYIYGFEKKVEILVSPPHILIILGVVLIISGVYRSLSKAEGLFSTYIRIFLFTVIFSFAGFITMYANPLVYPFSSFFHTPTSMIFGKDVEFLHIVSLASIFMHTGIVTFSILFIYKNLRNIPIGFTLILTVNTLLLSSLKGNYLFVIPALMAGFLTDLCRSKFKDLDEDKKILFIFTGMPIVFYSTYFEVLIFNRQLWWPYPLTLGAIFLSGLEGWLIASFYIHTKNEK